MELSKTNSTLPKAFTSNSLGVKNKFSRIRIIVKIHGFLIRGFIISKN